MKNTIAGLLLALLCPFASGAQTADLVPTDGITNDVHKANVGRVTFMAKPIPPEKYTEADFLETFTLTRKCDLNIRVFMDNSITNYLHKLEPGLDAETLNQKGNLRFSFYVDGELVYKENLHPGAGGAANKSRRTTFRVPFLSTKNEDSWGRFLWTRFYWSGGEEKLTEGQHTLKIEIRPYILADTPKTGDIVARGELRLTVVKPKVTEQQVAVQPIQPGGDWPTSAETFDAEKIKMLNKKIAQGDYKNITSVVIIKNGKLLLEEYFNGAKRSTLHDTRSVGKSFTSALVGMAIGDGYIKSENQTVAEFYDLKKYNNYSPQKETVTLKSLLMMSSGFTGNDMDPQSPGNEEKMYITPNWVKFMLDLPMDSNKTVGKNWEYFTAGVTLLGDIVNKTVPGGMEKYADTKLFQPLGITHRKWKYTPQRQPSAGGGLQMSATDFAKFGWLYKQGGNWNGQQIIPKIWVDASLSKQLDVPEDSPENYGYLFWYKKYNSGGKSHDAFYCSGNGGNKIIIFPQLPVVMVITATAYNQNYAHVQADKIVELFLLPAIL